ncbi:24320_t:CDS:2 [Racocetra persica]|uniref:24320_t:CDS:1 n=1 Tax=Racocetra persica TaxID=160502 RepID=A0ACA9N8A1_9GLOM|nr:24320_t:CDS:2 [Racocetra persica]
MFSNSNDDNFSELNIPKYQEDNESDNILLEVEIVFDNYDYAKWFLNQYARNNKFVVVKEQVEKNKINKSIVVKKIFKYHHGRSQKPKLLFILYNKEIINQKKLIVYEH